MVDASLELWDSLGDGIKRVERNELDTVVIQRRAIRLRRDTTTDHFLSLKDLEFLRPCPAEALNPSQLNLCVGKKLNTSLQQGSHLTLENFAIDD